MIRFIAKKVQRQVVSSTVELKVNEDGWSVYIVITTGSPQLRNKQADT